MNIVSLPRYLKKTIAVVTDLLVCFLTTWIAFCLRFDDVVLPSVSVVFAASVSCALAIPIFSQFGLYREIFRYRGWYASISLIKAIVIYSIIYATLILGYGFNGVPRSIGLIQPMLFFIVVGMSRLAAKFVLGSFAKTKEELRKKRSALIYGAGAAGRQLASGLRQSKEICPIGFVDDNSELWVVLLMGFLSIPQVKLRNF